MNEIEKQIEEMAREIQKSVDGCAEYWATLIAKHLIEQDYRNCKDKVVLSKEELNMLIGNIEKSSEIKAEELKQARKETAREIIKSIKQKYGISCRQYYPFLLIECLSSELDELVKEYGVEVE